MELSCSFCGKRKSQVAKLVGGSGETYICDECVRLCVEILHAEGIEESLTAPEHGSVADPLLYRRLLNVQSELANMQVGLRRLRRRVSELAENVSEPRA